MIIANDLEKYSIPIPLIGKNVKSLSIMNGDYCMLHISRYIKDETPTNYVAQYSISLGEYRRKIGVIAQLSEYTKGKSRVDKIYYHFDGKNYHSKRTALFGDRYYLETGDIIVASFVTQEQNVCKPARLYKAGERKRYNFFKGEKIIIRPDQFSGQWVELSIDLKRILSHGIINKYGARETIATYNYISGRLDSVKYSDGKELKYIYFKEDKNDKNTSING